MSEMRKVSEQYYLKQIICCCLIYLLAFGLPVKTAMALMPTTPVNTAADGAIVDQAVAGVTNVTVTKNQTIMQWSNFNTVSGETVDFAQAKGISGAAVLNRISGGQTQFNGNLYSDSDMSIFMVNPAGIVFGNGASVNVGQLVASSLNITDADFLAGNYNFTGGAAAGPVIVDSGAYIYADDLVALVGKSVITSGVLDGRYVVMAAGDTVTIGQQGSAIGVDIAIPEGSVVSDYLAKADYDAEIYAKDVVLAAGDVWSSAYIDAYDYDKNASASVKMDAKNGIYVNGQVYAYAVTEEGTAKASIEMTTANDGDDIVIDSDASVFSEAYAGGFIQLVEEGQDMTVADASIDIQSCANVYINGNIVSYAEIFESERVQESKTEQLDYDYFLGDTRSTIGIRAFEDVFVNQPLMNDDYSDQGYEVKALQSKSSMNGIIQAYAGYGYKNTSNVQIEAVSDVVINESEELETRWPGVMALAYDGYINDASVNLATRDAVDNGDILVNTMVGAIAESYLDDSLNTAKVEMSAARDIVVGGGSSTMNYDPRFIELVYFDHETESAGGYVLAETYGGRIFGPEQNVSEITMLANRDVVLEGGTVTYVETTGLKGNSNFYESGANIIASAMDAVYNDAVVTIAAERDVVVGGGTEVDVPELKYGATTPELVKSAYILAEAGSSEGMENRAEVGLYAGNDLTQDGDIEVAVSDYSYPGTVVFNAKADGQISGSGNVILEGKGSKVTKTLTVDTPVDNFAGDTYGDNIDFIEGPIDFPAIAAVGFAWIDWTWCADCEKDSPNPNPFIPAAPLAPYDPPRNFGCPSLVDAAAAELGVTSDSIQIAFGANLASNPTVQACAACASLVNAANVLKDADGTGMAAMMQAFNTLAPAGAPFTPEMSSSVAMALGDAAEGSQYATAMEYVDAFVDYVAVLDTTFGAEKEEAVAYVMDKYGAGIAANPNIQAYITAELNK